MNAILKMTTHEPKNLDKWKMPSSYFGATHEDSYVFLGQNRDSDVLTRCNFEVALEELGGESETVQVIHEGHWAVGWVEWIKIDANDLKALRKADAMAEALDNYPILDEQRFSDMEYEESQECLRSNLSWFIRDLCKELDLDYSELSKGQYEALEAFISAAFDYEGSYSGEAWFCVDRAKRNYDSFKGDIYYPKAASKRLIKALDAKFGGKA
jgi:hypothetical protein